MSIDSKTNWKPRIVVLTCNWCSYATVDLAGLKHLEYPADVQLMIVKCSGQMDPSFIIEVFRNCADGILVAGCTDKDCYLGPDYMYDHAKHDQIKEFLVQAGIEEDRYQSAWGPKSSGPYFQKTLKNLVEQVWQLGALTGHGEIKLSSPPSETLC